MSLSAEPSRPGQSQLLAERYDVALLDLDGVVYVGPNPVEHAADALARARSRGMRLAFVTNNASRTPEAVAGHLTELGIEAARAEVVTSAHAAVGLLAEELRPGARVLVVGGEGLRAALHERGMQPVSSLDDRPEAVVQGFAPDVGWADLAEGAYAVQRGLPWVASNADRTIPTVRGLAPGNGMLVAAISAATGRQPVVAGKPEPPMHREAMARTGAERPLVVGDRLDTDIEGAQRAGVDSLLVLTGVTTPVDLLCAPHELRPTYVGLDLRALDRSAQSQHVQAGRDVAGAWKATVIDGRLNLNRAEPGGVADDPSRAAEDYADALRAACGAVWAYEGDVDEKSLEWAFHGIG